jgi:hypothetical protein
MNIGSIMGGRPDPSAIAGMQRRMFEKVDGNSDGGIDLDEMKSIGSEMGLDTSKIEEQFGQLDTDGNGSIDSQEHEALFEKIGEKLRGAFGGQTGSTGSTETDDMLLKMMEKIREHSAQSEGAGGQIQQFLAQLQQQNGGYASDGSRSSSAVPSYFSSVA